MWKLVEKIGHKSKCKNVSYYDLSEEEKIHILTEVLDDNYEIYTRETEGILDIMVHDTILHNYYDEEQEGYLNIINFWNDVIVGD